MASKDSKFWPILVRIEDGHGTQRTQKLVGLTFIGLALVLIFLALAFTAVATAEQPQDLHCPDGGTKTEAVVEGELDGVVPPAGTEVCVKAGPGNTGIVIADGESTLCDLLADAGIVGGNGECRNVSYYVVYEGTTDDGTTDGQTDDGSTDDGTTDGSTDGTVEPTPEPTPEPPVIKKKAPKLARTGLDAVSGLWLAALGLFLVGSGLLMRRRAA